MKREISILLAVLVLAAGCATLYEDTQRQHVIVRDSDGSDPGWLDTLFDPSVALALAAIADPFVAPYVVGVEAVRMIGGALNVAVGTGSGVILDVSAPDGSGIESSTIEVNGVKVKAGAVGKKSISPVAGRLLE